MQDVHNFFFYNKGKGVKVQSNQQHDVLRVQQEDWPKHYWFNIPYKTVAEACLR
jgi:hypothetical protein